MRPSYLKTWAAQRPGADVVDVFIVRYTRTPKGPVGEQFVAGEWVPYEPMEQLTPVVSLDRVAILEHDLVPVTRALHRAAASLGLPATLDEFGDVGIDLEGGA